MTSATTTTQTTEFYTDADALRFLDKVDAPADLDTSVCWYWRGAKHGQGRGYGKFRLGGKVISAHRAAYLLFNGAVACGQVIGHLCNDERCCNPHHLVAQSQSDNIKYAVICGRHNSCHQH